MQPRQERAVFLRRQHFADFSILFRQVVIIRVDAERVRQEAQVPHAHEGQRDFVVAAAILVHVAVAELTKHLRQFLCGRRHSHFQAFKPRLVNPHGIVRRQFVDARQCDNRAVGQRNGFQPFRVGFQQRPDVRRVLRQIRAQVNQLARFIERKRLLRGQFRLEEHIRHGNLARQHFRFRLRPCLSADVFGKGEGNSGFFLHCLEE